jgi:cobaltochelatase CobN
MVATIRARLFGKAYFGDFPPSGREPGQDLKEETLRVYRGRVINPKWLAVCSVTATKVVWN